MMAKPTFARASAGQRSRPRAYLLLARISNMPTVWTNVLAAHVAAGAALDTVPAAAAAMSCLYMGGMVLNDVCDETRVRRSGFA